MFNFDIWYQGKNQFFIFNTDLDEYIGSLGNYHFYINDKYQRFGKTIADLNFFMIKYYWDFNPSHNRVIYNEDVYVKMPLAERKKIVIRQQKNSILYLNPGISIFAATKNFKGTKILMKYATFLRKIKIPNKYLTNFKKRYPGFIPTAFEEYHFTKVTGTWGENDLHHYQHYIWPIFREEIFFNDNEQYNK